MSAILYIYSVYPGHVAVWYSAVCNMCLVAGIRLRLACCVATLVSQLHCRLISNQFLDALARVTSTNVNRSGQATKNMHTTVPEPPPSAKALLQWKD